MVEVFVFVFGLIVGSFLNAVIYRIKIRTSVVIGRSQCPRCHHELAVRDLIPVVSYIMLRGKCRYCGKKISWQYPIIELATALLLLGVYVRLVELYGVSSELVIRFLFLACFTGFLIVIFVYDLKYYLILDIVIYPALIIALIANLSLGYEWWKLIGAALLCGGFFALQYYMSRGKWIGGGDIRLGALMGVMLSWPHVLVALFLAYMIGSVVGLGLIAMGKKTFGSKVPFGTFLTVATYITMLYGDSIIGWYQQMAYI